LIDIKAEKAAVWSFQASGPFATMLVAEADGVIVPAEEKFIARWKKMAATMDQEEVA
jgi:hypothetical protein